MPEPTPLLKMTGIKKRFPGVVALNGVDFRVNAGEIHALMGQNGAGKSTLIKVLTGVHTRDAGEILVDGKPFSARSPGHAQELGVSTVYQEVNLIPSLSVAENLFLGRQPLRFGQLDWGALTKRAQMAVQRLDIDIDVSRRLSTYPIAIQQMVAIAKALGRDARILVLDEPTAALTDTETQTLFRVLRRLREDGVTCIYISHRIEEVLDLVDRVTVLRDGRVVDTIPVSAEVEYSDLVHMMVGRALTDMYPKKAAAIGQAVLRVEHLSLDHPFINGRKSLQDVSFAVHRGEILGIGGLVGSGRSEIVTSLFGMNGKRVQGQVFIDGEPVDIRTPLDAKRHGMGLLTENRRKNGLIVTFPIVQNVTLANLNRVSRHHILNHSQERRLAREQIDVLNIVAPSIDAIVNNLSGGNQQKVIISKWLLTDLHILLLDEPTQGIDVGAKAEIYKLMEHLSQQGMAIIWISSELPELLAMSDRIMVLADGRVQGTLSREEATQVRVMELATHFR